MDINELKGFYHQAEALKKAIDNINLERKTFTREATKDIRQFIKWILIFSTIVCSIIFFIGYGESYISSIGAAISLFVFVEIVILMVSVFCLLIMKDKAQNKFFREYPKKKELWKFHRETLNVLG